MKTSKYILLLCFVLLSSIAFYGLDRWNQKMIDDWHYSYISQPQGKNFFSYVEEDYPRERVTSWSDAVRSQQQEYFKDNGRFLTHTVAQYLCGTTSIGTFVVYNSVVFCLFLLLLAVTSYDSDYNLSKLVWLLAAVWFCIPFKGLSILGNIAPSVNYLWTATWTLAFLLLLRKVSSAERRLPVAALIGLFILSAIIGSLQESFSIGLAGALFFYYAFQRKKINVNNAVMTLGYFLGTAILVFAPANFVRLEGNGGIGIHLNAILGAMFSPSVVALGVILMLGLWFRRKATVTFIKDNALLLLALLISFVFAFFIAYNGRHQFTFGYILSVVLLMRWLQTLSIKPAWQKVTAVVLLALMAVTYVPVLQARKAYTQGFNHLMAQAAASQEGIVCSRPFADAQYAVCRNDLLNNNLVLTIDFSGEESFWQKCVSIEVSGGKTIHHFRQFLPDTPGNIAKACNSDSQIADSLYRIFDGYVVAVTTTDSVPTIVTERKAKISLMSPTTLEDKPCNHFVWNGRHYYIFNNLPEIISARRP